MSHKLGPIYEALDSRNPKLAVKLCDSILKKSGVPIVAALKAVALDRMGKGEEAFSLAKETAKAAQTAPVDDHLLGTLLLTYKSSGKLDEMLGVYEAAHKVDPGNIEVAQSLFAEYLRASEFAKAQSLSMRRMKGGDAEQLYWAVTCLLLQVDAMGPPQQPTRHYADAKPAEGAAKHLQLGAAMLGRAVDQGKLTAPTHLQLYLEVLRRQRAHAEALTLLTNHGPLAGAKSALLRAQAELFEKRGLLRKAQHAHKEIVEHHAPEDWEAYRSLLRCAAALDSGVPAAVDAAGEDVADPVDVDALLTALRSANPKCRGPHLAQLVRLLSAADPAAAAAALSLSNHTTSMGAHERSPALVGLPLAPAPSASRIPDVSDATPGPPSDAVMALVQAFHEYFEAHGEKTACTLDTLPLLCALESPSAQRALLAPLEAKYAPEQRPSTPDLPWLRRCSCLAQWRLGCGEPRRASLPDRMEMAKGFMEAYRHHAPLSKGLDSRERGHGDVMAHLAAQALLPLPTADWPASSGSGMHSWPLQPVLGAALALRRALDASPHNFQIALALLNVYLCLGAPTAAIALYKGLSIKYIQYESLSYLVLPTADALGATTGMHGSDQCLSDVRRFQSHGLHELPENLGLAFKSGSYPQALEFVALRRSLEQSWWHSFTDVLQATRNLRSSAANAAAVATALGGAPFLTMDLSPAALASLPDPTDLAVFEEHLPHDGVRRLAALRQVWLPRRALLLRCIWHAVRGTDTEIESALATSAEALGALVGAEPSAGGGGTDAGKADEVMEDWAPLVGMVQLTSLLMRRATAAEGGAAPGCTNTELLAAAQTASAALKTAAAAPLARLAAAGGVPARSMAEIAHLGQLVVPTLCVLLQRWEALLGGKKKKKAGGDAAGEAGQAEQADPRGVLRDALQTIIGSVGDVGALLAASGRRSAACLQLEQASTEWDSFLGGDAVATETRLGLTKTLDDASEVSFAALATAMKNGATTLKHLAKSL